LKIYADTALLADGWADAVVLEVGADGRIAALERGAAPPPRAERAAGPVLPGMPDLHSHAFQRALSGHVERRAGDDDFWSWRALMYDFVARVTPRQLEAIAAWLYVEMLEAGYTQVSEFHYLHHAPDGRPYDELAEMSGRIAAAAGRAGIAITLLPVLYAHGGFGGAPPDPAQLRFVNDGDRYARLLDALLAALGNAADVRVGAAPHSLRAVTPALLAGAIEALDALAPGAPVHVHVAEQEREVLECIAWSGARPVAWLLDRAPVDGRWCLVHATHLTDTERDALAASGAVAGLCPTTEANLGDGVFPAVEYLAGGGRIGIGSDSNVSVSPVEELRLLEYGQRLAHRRRGLLAERAGGSVGATLWRRAAAGGAQVSGFDCGRLAPGARADLVVLDAAAPVLLDKRGDAILDALVFAGNTPLVRDVMVGGRWRVREGRHPDRDALLARYHAALRELWS